MIGLIRLWYKSKKLRYSTYLKTYNELTTKFEENIEAMPLAELMQFHFMAKEVTSMAMLAGSMLVNKSNLEQQPEKPDGQYL